MNREIAQRGSGLPVPIIMSEWEAVIEITIQFGVPKLAGDRMLKSGFWDGHCWYRSSSRLQDLETVGNRYGTINTTLFDRKTTLNIVLSSETTFFGGSDVR